MFSLTTFAFSFQFLIVQLKVTSYNQQERIVWFQFLIVQLKDRKRLDKILLAKVSIPYSTIKSREPDDGAAQDKAVSIPYSTIKSVRALGAASVDAVSIPYSTIKSIRSFPIFCRCLGFNSL